MYEPDKKLCQRFIEFSYNAVLNEAESVIVYKGVSHFRLSPHFSKDRYVALVDVRTNKDMRGKGIGTEMMEALVDFLDCERLTCVVHPESYGDNKNNKKLRAWYKRHGFKPVANKEIMIRR